MVDHRSSIPFAKCRPRMLWALALAICAAHQVFSAVLFAGFARLPYGRHSSVLPRSAEAAEGGLSEASDDSIEFFLKKEALKRGLSPSASLADFAETRELKDLEAGDVLVLRLPEAMMEESDDTARTRWTSTLQRLGGSEVLWNSMARRQAPVVLITRHDEETTEGLLLTERTGRLMGDYVDAFYSRPLLFGGPVVGDRRVTMVHPYQQVPDCSQLGRIGLHVGSDVKQAQEWVDDPDNCASSLRFRFFIGRVRWQRGELDQEVSYEHWLPMHVSRDLILSEELDRDGKALHTAIADLADEDTQAELYKWSG
mmetsp:Transcript_46629/g.110881  ORF Transcript_46629/g.110881 Transcript_46629/m.110881 type:complete len:312 (+) Transcript_46629:75-1010(+)